VEDFEEFKKWYNETLFEKALGGDLEKLLVNYEVEGTSIGDRIIASNSTEKEALSVPNFFYFKNDGIYYPTYIVTVYNPKYDNKETFAIVVDPKMSIRYNGYDPISSVSEGGGLRYMDMLFFKSECFPDVRNNLIDKGFGTCYPSTVGEIPIGFGLIKCFDN
jgi:hypothetical protein